MCVYLCVCIVYVSLSKGAPLSLLTNTHTHTLNHKQHTCMRSPPPVQATPHLWDDYSTSQKGCDCKCIAQAIQLVVDKRKVTLCSKMIMCVTLYESQSWKNGIRIAQAIQLVIDERKVAMQQQRRMWYKTEPLSSKHFLTANTHTLPCNFRLCTLHPSHPDTPAHCPGSCIDCVHLPTHTSAHIHTYTHTRTQHTHTCTLSRFMRPVAGPASFNSASRPSIYS